MSSIMTNSAALTALQSLNATSKALTDTQARISTGYRVSQASDNAAYWSIATTMRSDNQAMSTVSDALGLGASKVDTAYTGMNSAISTINQIKAKLLASYGQTDAYGYNIADDKGNPLSPEMDRFTPGAVHVHDLQATILHLLGIDHEQLTYKFQGRRYRLTDVHGHVVKDLLA